MMRQNACIRSLHVCAPSSMPLVAGARSVSARFCLSRADWPTLFCSSSTKAADRGRSSCPSFVMITCSKAAKILTSALVPARMSTNMWHRVDTVSGPAAALSITVRPTS